ncbi:MAG: tRNA (adenosine(37)-N6)-threonylcarbamoyltransferase complex dimerization subunit type 1 TsaB [Saprospiraceae bacterium]|nr:tRNA (adenosine(37)-N6)-threonylcarbamoyltransferase complex dimerization subunit type 1 TsaB [Saprospiraceae bacterium]
MILCIETSTAICSVALASGTKLIALGESSNANDHASRLLNHIDTCLNEGQIKLVDLQAIAVSLGPGSFTGLRVGIAAAKGISFALGTPLIGINTLEALIWKAQKTGSGRRYFCAMIKARKDEVYTMISDREGNITLAPGVVELYNGWHQELLAGSNDVLFCGDGIHRYQELCQSNSLKSVDIKTSSVNLIHLAQRKHIKKDYSEGKTFGPSYIKRPHITQARKVL